MQLQRPLLAFSLLRPPEKAFDIMQIRLSYAIHAINLLLSDIFWKLNFQIWHESTACPVSGLRQSRSDFLISHIKVSLEINTENRLSRNEIWEFATFSLLRIILSSCFLFDSSQLEITSRQDIVAFGRLEHYKIL